PIPMEQRLGKNCKWGKARPFRSRATILDWPEHITAQDMLALAILENRLDNRPDGEASLPDCAAQTIKALTGHANLFWDGGAGAAPTPTEIVPAQPWCRLLTSAEDDVTLAMHPQLTPGHRLTARHEPDNKIALYSFSRQAQAVAARLGNGVTLPPTALSAAKAVLLELSQQFAMLSDIALDFLGVAGASAPSQPVFRLTPSERGLVIDLVLRPFAGHPHPFPPGQGPREFLQPTSGSIVRTIRNPALEEQTAETIVNACPALTGHDNGAWQWRLPEPEMCYEFLLQVQALGECCQVEWPQSAPIRMTRPISFSDVQLETRCQGDWFSVSGEVQVNEQLTVTFQELLRAARDNSSSRFLQLDNGQIVCLTDSFRRRLQEIAAISDLRDQDVRFHLFTLPLTDRLLAEAGDLRYAPEWLKRLQDIDRAQKLQPKIPSGLRATLRAYQYDGYAWMSRLDAWGAGACLADDMGLGKTIQAIAFILAKTAEGPALVIAPTSVCMNWRLEIERFAPNLEVTLFGPGDRQEVLANMGPGKVMISSYGLLQSEEQTVAEIHWRVAVLDEAQAIKNFNAKRSQAALKIDADFRLATTGTPIENNLDELWSIFHFINPGLLGSRRHFQRRFATPIEREGSQAASSQLNALISPFLLRRTKA
ncbi:MAG TPA: SNF2-related protein, partial [Lentisphaeria bacterium]|nr:SNF2-related protein [Lentisphaeria bacterium]